MIPLNCPERTTICKECGHPADRHWTMGQHLCSVAQGHNAKRDKAEKPCQCSGLLVAAKRSAA